jgi:hypothetical protein
MTKQKVIIIITEDEKTMTIVREKDFNWPGYEVPHITEMITELAEDAKTQIIDEENKEKN